MGWIAVFRVPPPQMRAPNRLYAYQMLPDLLDEEETAEASGQRIPTQPTVATIPSVASQPARR